MSDAEEDRELQMIVTMLRAMKEYVAWSLVFDGAIDTETMDGDQADETAVQELDQIIDPIRGNKAKGNVPFVNQDAHAILDAVARWRLENTAGRLRPLS